jgi:hypothetical protein
VLADEGGVFDMIAGYRYSKSGIPNLDVYLKSHDGTDIRIDRKGREPEFIPSPALTMACAVQPDVLRALAGNDVLRGRGLTARFLYALPRSLVSRRLIEPPEVPTEVEARYREGMRALLRGFCGPRPAIRRDWPTTIALDEEAKDVLLAFSAEVETRMGYGGDLMHVKDWAGKLTGNTARIAGLLQIAGTLEENWSKVGQNQDFCHYCPYVTKDNVAHAVAIADFLVEHALAVFDLMGADAHGSGARSVLEWMAEREDPTKPFTRREAHRAQQGRFRDVGQVKLALSMLCTHGFLREEQPESSGGRSPSPRYYPNPHWAGGF